ncbi:MAG: hypothetical protein LBB21_05735 [Holosporaceae bacterium]|jgi:hypothetical protein|nr:hypothetical protein [Holosporaceae bacterium]
MGETNLILGVAGFPPESARNCHQELSPIPNGEFRKSINGDLLYLETNERKRYRSVISCKDTNSPIIDGIWVGTQITIGCIQNLWQAIDCGKRSVRLVRPPVEGSVCVVNSCGEAIRFTLEDEEVKLSKSYDEKNFVCFRPWLITRVINFSLETNEWGMSGGWKLVVEEI